MKILILIISFMIFLSNCFVFAGCNNTIQPKTIQNIDYAVGELSIFTYDGKSESKYLLKNYGHSFLSLTNTSLEDYVVGNYYLKVGETISFSTWSVHCHFGVWYNIEANYIKTYNKYEGRISITTQVDKNDIEKITQFVNNNDTWQPLKNCSYFSINVWNLVTEIDSQIKKPLLYNPSYLSTQIKLFDNYQKNKQINSIETFGFYDNQYINYSFKENIYE